MLNNGYCALPFCGTTGAVRKSALCWKRVPQSRVITGNLMMPGFTAPKLLWVQRHEPEIFRQIDKVLLPKDYLRLRMTGSLPAICLTQLAPCGWMSQSVTGVTSCCRLATYLVTRCPHYTKAAKLLVLCYLKLRKRGVWRRCQLSQAVATMQLVQLVWEWLMLIRQCYRWGRRGLFCCQRRVLKQAKRCTQLLPCATAALAFNVCNAECSIVSGLGREINRPVQCPSFNRCSSTG